MDLGGEVGIVVARDQVAVLDRDNRQGLAAVPGFELAGQVGRDAPGSRDACHPSVRAQRQERFVNSGLERRVGDLQAAAGKHDVEAAACGAVLRQLGGQQVLGAERLRLLGALVIELAAEGETDACDHSEQKSRQHQHMPAAVVDKPSPELEHILALLSFRGQP